MNFSMFKFGHIHCCKRGFEYKSTAKDVDMGLHCLQRCLLRSPWLKELIRENWLSGIKVLSWFANVNIDLAMKGSYYNMKIDTVTLYCSDYFVIAFW